MLHLTKNLNPALFIQERTNESIAVDIPTFPVVNLWSIFKNVILYTDFFDAHIIKNLYTNHKLIFYPYDLNWYIESVDFNNTYFALTNCDLLIARCPYHAKKIEEICGRMPKLITEINLEQEINELYKSYNEST